MGGGKTISLFHCDDLNGTDVYGYASVQSKNLGLVSNGKFTYANSGQVQFKDNQWDDILLGESWTVDYWLYPRGHTNWAVDVFLGGDGNYNAIIRQETVYNLSQIVFLISGGSGWIGGSNNRVIVDMLAWHHIAIVYDGSSCAIYVDGLKRFNLNMIITRTYGNYNYFGRGPYNTEDNHGISSSYRDEIRISRGVVWKKDFNPPTAPYK